MILHALFFVQRYPSAWFYSDSNYFMGQVDATLRQAMGAALKGRVPEKWLIDASIPLAGLGIRTEGVDEAQALALARHQVEAFLDGLALVAYDGAPEVSKLVLVAEPHEENARFLVYAAEAYLEMGPTPPEKEPTMDQRAVAIADMLATVFDRLIGEHAKKDTPLAEQLSYALKMFRHGCSAGAYAIEFVCKFSAMEGLVCGGEVGRKRANLVERLSQLFPQDPQLSTAYFDELWDVRNQAVHESRGFHSEFDARPLDVQRHLEHLDRIFLAVVTFVVTHLDRAATVRDLWPMASGYVLPEFTKSFRPITGRHRFISRRVRMETNARLPAAQSVFKPFRDQEAGA